MVLHYQQKFIDGYGLVSAWLIVSKNAIVQVLDTVRNRTLNRVKIGAKIGVEILTAWLKQYDGL